MSRAVIVLMVSIAVSPACVGLRVGTASTDEGQADLEKVLAAKGAAGLRHHRPRRHTALEAHPRVLRPPRERDGVDRREAPAPADGRVHRSARRVGREGLDPEALQLHGARGAAKGGRQRLPHQERFRSGRGRALDVVAHLPVHEVRVRPRRRHLRPRAGRSPWRIEPESFDPLEHLEKALSSKAVEESLRSLDAERSAVPAAPRQSRRLPQDRRSGRMAPGPARARFKRGDTSQHVTVLAARLAGDRRLPRSSARRRPTRSTTQSSPTPSSGSSARHGLEPTTGRPVRRWSRR